MILPKFSKRHTPILMPIHCFFASLYPSLYYIPSILKLSIISCPDMLSCLLVLPTSVSLLPAYCLPLSSTLSFLLILFPFLFFSFTALLFKVFFFSALSPNLFRRIYHFLTLLYLWLSFISTFPYVFHLYCFIVFFLSHLSSLSDIHSLILLFILIFTGDVPPCKYLYPWADLISAIGAFYQSLLTLLSLVFKLLSSSFL